MLAAGIAVPAVRIASTVASLGFSLLFGGAASTTVGGTSTLLGSLWTSKSMWENFLRIEFKKKEGKFLKDELYNCISHLQYLNDSILNNNDDSYFGNNPTPIFDPPLANPPKISDIKNAAQLLHFICDLQKGEFVSKAKMEIEGIWKNTIKTVTETIVKQLCETETDYYETPGPLEIMKVPLEKILPIRTSLPFGDLTNQLNQKGLKHIPTEFVDLLLKNYSKNLQANYRHQMPIYPPIEKVPKIIFYMRLCKFIYTDHTTKVFVPSTLPLHISQIWQEIITNKNEVDRLFNTLTGVRNQNDGISNRSLTFEAKGKNVQSEQRAAISRSKLTPLIQEDYTNCIIQINIFLNKIEENPFTDYDLRMIGSTIRDLEKIRNKIHSQFNWYFNENHVDKNNNKRKYICDKREYPLSHQAIVAASFLNKSLLNLRRKIVILDVGFRNLHKLEGICNVFKDKLLKFKKNPLAWFNGLGEVDYIAYIERDSSQTNPIKDKLVIVYSGSNSIGDWKTNFTLDYSVFGDLIVHGGMGKLMGESKETYFSNLIGKIRDYYSTHRTPQKFKIVTTGHSLGGALALLAAYYFKHETMEILSNVLNIDEKNISVKCYTFGAPAIIVDEQSKLTFENILGKNNIIVTWNYHVCSIIYLIQKIGINIFILRVIKLMIIKKDPVLFLTKILAFEVGISFPLFNINSNNFGFFDQSIVGRWGHHDADRYLHHLECLLNPLPDSPMRNFITLLKDYANNFRNFYKVGRDGGILTENGVF